MVRATIRIDFDGGGSIGPGKVRLLELIAETGSISAAARLLGMSYRQAWLLTDSLSQIFGSPALVAQSGGSKGGHAALTPKAKAAIEAYQKLSATIAQRCASELRALGAIASPGGGKRPLARRPLKQRPSKREKNAPASKSARSAKPPQRPG